MERRPHQEAAELRRLLDDERAADGADRRAAAAWEARIRRESASFDTVLRSATEHADSVVIVTASGAMLRGTIRGVGTDVLALESSTGQRTLIAVAAIETLRAGADRLDSTTATDPGVTLADHLRFLAENRTSVRLTTRSGATETGEVAMAGEDVCALRSATSWTYVPIAAISEAMEVRR